MSRQLPAHLLVLFLSLAIQPGIASTKDIVAEAEEIVAKWTFDQCHAYADHIVYGELTDRTLIKTDGGGYRLYSVQVKVLSSIRGRTTDTLRFERWYYQTKPALGRLVFQCLCGSDVGYYDPTGQSSFFRTEAMASYVADFAPPKKLYWDEPLCDGSSPGKPSKGPMMAAP